MDPDRRAAPAVAARIPRGRPTLPARAEAAAVALDRALGEGARVVDRPRFSCVSSAALSPETRALLVRAGFRCVTPLHLDGQEHWRAERADPPPPPRDAPDLLKELWSAAFGQRDDLGPECPCDVWLAESCDGDAIHVAAWGHDSNPGTARYPVRTIARAFELSIRGGGWQGTRSIRSREGKYPVRGSV